MPGLGDLLQGGPPPDEPGLGDRLLNQWKASLANRILSAPSKLFGGLVVDPAVEGVTDLVTLAGDVYGGRQPTMSADPQTGEMHTDPRLSERTANAAANLGTGGLATAGGRAGVGVFGGTLARTANLEKLATAKRMMAEGMPRERIWQETGWFKAPDKEWKFEINDEASRVPDRTIDALTQNVVRGGKAANAGTILEHPELYEAYPELWNLDVDAGYDVAYPDSRGYYQAGFEGKSPQIGIRTNALAGPEGPRSLMLHELQHPIQRIEGFAKGGSPAMFEGSGIDPMDAYRQLAGEVEARNVQRRRNFTPEERREIPPWQTQDIPTEQQRFNYAVNGPQASIRAYHGSPHDFERFDASKIGTGEGAQAYGHGLYFAEHPETAGAYKEMLTAKHNPEDQQMRRFLTGADENAPGEYFPEGTDFGSILGAGEERASISNAELVKRSLAHLERVKQGKGPLHAAALQKAQATVDYLKSNPQARFTGAPYQGRMYEVDIAADPEHFLDWDRPLSEQSPKVREKLGVHNEPRDFEAEAKAVPGTPEYEALTRKMDTRTGSPGVPDVTGAEFYRGDVLRGTAAGERDMSTALREAGIPGIRYLDQGSRGAGDGTRNYVVFPGNEHLIAILRKYGLPISAAGLAALSQLHPEEAQAGGLGDRLQSE